MLKILFLILVSLVPTFGEGHAQSAISKYANELDVQSLAIHGRTLKLKVAIEPRCFFGDIDTILLERGTSTKDTKFFLSIENILGNLEEPPSAVEFSFPFKFVKDKMEFELSLPAGKYRGVMGLFICKESSGKFSSCKSKRFVDFGEIMKRYEVKYDKNTKKIAQIPGAKTDFQPSVDKTYFFKPFVVDQYKILLPTKAMTVERYQYFRDILVSFGLEQSLVQREVENIRFMSTTLGSLPLSTKGNDVVMTMPVFGGAKCGIN